jgi:hypothetical protein
MSSLCMKSTQELYIHTYLTMLMVHSNTSPLCIGFPSEWSLFQFSHQIPVFISFLPHIYHLFCPSRPSIDHISDIWWGVQVMGLLNRMKRITFTDRSFLNTFIQFRHSTLASLYKEITTNHWNILFNPLVYYTIPILQCNYIFTKN